MAALRLGYLVAHPEVVDGLQAGRTPLPPRRRKTGRRCAGARLPGRDEPAGSARLLEQRNRLAARAPPALGPRVLAVGRQLHPLPGGVLTSRRTSGRRLLEHSVLVRDVSGWPGLEGCLRVTVGTPEENDRFLAGLEAVLADAGRRRGDARRRSRGCGARWAGLGRWNAGQSSAEHIHDARHSFSPAPYFQVSRRPRRTCTKWAKTPSASRPGPRSAVECGRCSTPSPLATTSSTA